MAAGVPADLGRCAMRLAPRPVAVNTAADYLAEMGDLGRIGQSSYLDKVGIQLKAARGAGL